MLPGESSPVVGQRSTIYQVDMGKYGSLIGNASSVRLTLRVVDSPRAWDATCDGVILRLFFDKVAALLLHLFVLLCLKCVTFPPGPTVSAEGPTRQVRCL